MVTKAENPSAFLKDKDVSPVLRLYFDLTHLKQLYRKGWLERAVPPSRCESVADHSCSTPRRSLVHKRKGARRAPLFFFSCCVRYDDLSSLIDLSVRLAAKAR